MRNQITCYPFGIDRIGGRFDGGLRLWRACYAPDLQFSANLGRRDDQMSGRRLSVPERDMSPVDMRAALANALSMARASVKTSHHLTNVAIKVDGAKAPSTPTCKPGTGRRTIRSSSRREPGMSN